MACETAIYRHFFVVRWGDFTVEDVDRVVAEVIELEARAKRPIYYIGILPKDMPNITEYQRNHFMRLSEELLSRCGVFAVVIEAKGFRGAIQRSAMAAITLLTRRYKGLRFVDSLSSALSIEPRARPDDTGVALALGKVGADIPDSLLAEAG